MTKATKRLVILLVFIAGLFIITIFSTGKHAFDVVFGGLVVTSYFTPSHPRMKNGQLIYSKGIAELRPIIPIS